MKWYLKITTIVMTISALSFMSCSKDDENVIYTVTFDTGGGSPVPVTQHVEAGSAATVPVTNPSKTGYVFLFWYLNGTSTAYNFSTPVNSDITLQARWEEEAKVEYWQVSWELNGGVWPATDDNHATQVVKGGTLSEPAPPIKAGNTFDGWYREAALTNEVFFPYDVSPVTGNFTLYARWSAGSAGDYKVFTSIAELRSWLAGQSANTVETAYKAELKSVNLDAGNNWVNLSLAIKGSKYVDLNLQSCTGATITEGYYDREVHGTVVTYTYYGVFLDMNNLVAVTLPKGLKTIGKYAFYECENLASVALPEGLTGIHEEAFRSCVRLSDINFPQSITGINGSAFYNCNKLASFTVPANLKEIGKFAFQFCGLTTITIPGSMADAEWGSHVFADNNSLTGVVIGEGIEHLEIGVFSGCWSLESASLPASFKIIVQDMFKDCKALKVLEVPAGVTSIGGSAFNNAFTSGTLIMRSVTPPTLAWRPFEYASIDVIKVPAASLNAYKTANGWSAYAGKIVANTD
ncbi:MAG: leucine-rich repeat protein [Tannerellaceae bacterium]|nr:leucine-rich repeat protein [Tannerellaceae bacterium]